MVTPKTKEIRTMNKIDLWKTSEKLKDHQNFKKHKLTNRYVFQKQVHINIFKTKLKNILRYQTDKLIHKSIYHVLIKWSINGYDRRNSFQFLFLFERSIKDFHFVSLSGTNHHLFLNNLHKFPTFVLLGGFCFIIGPTWYQGTKPC